MFPHKTVQAEDAPLALLLSWCSTQKAQLQTLFPKPCNARVHLQISQTSVWCADSQPLTFFFF